MKAVAVYPGKPNSGHLADISEPRIDEIPDGRGVLVRVLRVGLDGTDKEIDAGQYGSAPDGSDVLVLGHESFGVVDQTGRAVTELRAGDYVVSRVRRAGGSVYDRLDMPDLTTDDTYFKHGISKVHGFLTERYVEDVRYLIRVPRELREIGVLLEPTSVVEKGITQAYEVQRRLKVWDPKRAAVLGAGTLGLLATMVLRNRGLDVVAFALEPPPYLNSELVKAIGARYVSTKQRSLDDVVRDDGPFDLVFECTGFSPLVFDAMRMLLAKNAVLVLTSVTGGDRRIEIASDEINLGFVLGNKAMVGSVNANREHFDRGVEDLATAEARWPGWPARLLTHRVRALDRFREALDLLGAAGAIKVFVEVAPIADGG